VKAPERAEFVIGGEINREGLGYTAKFVLVKAQDGTVLAEETLYYRDFLEVSAYMPGIADSLARKAVPGIPPARTALLPRPELPVPAARVAPPEPVKPAPKEPAKPVVTAPVETPPKPAAAVPAKTEPAIEVKAPAGDVDPNVWRNKLFYLGIWTGYDFMGGGMSVAGELDWRPSRFFGFKMGLGSASYKAEFWQESSYYVSYGYPSYNGYWMFNGSSEDYQSENGLLYYFAPRVNVAMRRSNLGLTAGYALINVKYPEASSFFNNDDNSTVTHGGIFGVDLEVKAGPGMFFATLNGIVTFSGSERNFSNGSYRERMYCYGATSVHIGVGYRFGIVNKKPWK
jgi:hypothetical protein